MSEQVLLLQSGSALVQEVLGKPTFKKIPDAINDSGPAHPYADRV